MSECKHVAGFGPTAICCYCQESASNVIFSMQARIDKLEAEFSWMQGERDTYKASNRRLRKESEGRMMRIDKLLELCRKYDVPYFEQLDTGLETENLR